MARTRLIKPRFFRSIELYKAELEVNRENKGPYLNIRTAFAGLFTVADKEGRFEWSPEELKLDCLPYDPIDFEKILGALSKYGNPPFIFEYRVGGKRFGAITEIKQYQHFHYKEPESILPVPPIEKPKSKPESQPDSKPEAGPEPETLCQTTKDTPAQSCVWKLASVCGIRFRNKAEVNVYFKKHIAAAHELMKLAGGETVIAHRAIIDIWAWLQKKAESGDISDPENLQAVVNNYIKWRQEYDRLQTEQEPKEVF